MMQELTSPDPEEHPAVYGHNLVSHSQHTLDLHTALNRIEGIGELRQHVVAGGIHDPAPMLPNPVRDACPALAQDPSEANDDAVVRDVDLTDVSVPDALRMLAVATA